MILIPLFKGFLSLSRDGLSHPLVISFFPGLSQLPSEGSSCFDFVFAQDELEDFSFPTVRFLKYYLSSYSDFLRWIPSWSFL